ncbi:Glycosyltransferase [uncultured Thiomicrorhabdus sp.]
MKIAQLLYSGLGGHGSVAWGVYEGLKVSGYETSLGFHGIEPMAKPYADRCSREGLSCQYIPSKPGRSFLAWPKIFFWLIKDRSDVIILHSVKTLLPCLIYKWLFNAKIIFVEHQANHLKTQFECVISKLGMKFSDRIVYLTDAYKAELKNYIGKPFSDKKAFVIPNGIDCKTFTQPLDKKVIGNSVQLGMAARFTNLRHQEFLVDLVYLLKQQYPQVEWNLTLAGSGPTSADVKKRIAELQLENAVDLCGHLDENELVSWFHEVDIYVHATKGETLSTSMLQAMACGLPIVASDVKGVTNLMSYEPKFGECVTSLDIEAFSVAIYKIASNAGIFENYSQNARQVAENHFSLESMANAYLSIVKKFKEDN